MKSVVEYEPRDRDIDGDQTIGGEDLTIWFDLAKPERWRKGERLADRDFRV